MATQKKWNDRKRKPGDLSGEVASVVIPSIQATSPTPLKATGDLAQVSTGPTGTEVPLIGLMEWDIDWKRATVDSTTTENAGNKGTLGSQASWSATAKFAYVDGDASQTSIRAAISYLQTTSAKYNFFNSPVSGRDSWSGNGILTGIKFSTGQKKIFGMDVTIEGDGPLTLIAQLAPGTGTAGQSPLIAED